MKKQIINKPYSIERTAPKGDKKYIQNFSQDFRYNHTNYNYIYEFKNCFLTHYGPILKSMQFTPVLTSQMKQKPIYLIKLYLSCLKKILLNKVIEIDKKCLVVHNNYYDNYYHWVLEIFFRLYLVKDYLKDHALVLPKTSYKFQNQMLSLLDIKEEQIIRLNPQFLIKAKEIITPQYLASYGNYEPKLLTQFANWILSKQKEKINSQEISQNIYITRKKANYRKIDNEELLINQLTALNFIIKDLEDLDLYSQIALFNNAKLIVAPHGAGLTNLIYCKPQTLIVELLPEDYTHTCFYNLANVFNLDYYYVIGESTNKSKKLKPYQFNMRINIEDLINLLKIEILPKINKQ